MTAYRSVEILHLHSLPSSKNADPSADRITAQLFFPMDAITLPTTLRESGVPILLISNKIRIDTRDPHGSATDRTAVINRKIFASPGVTVITPAPRIFVCFRLGGKPSLQGAPSLRHPQFKNHG